MEPLQAVTTVLFRESLQKPQWVLLERDIEEDLDVVQKNHIGCG
jgi:hypothetical protein